MKPWKLVLLITGIAGLSSCNTGNSKYSVATSDSITVLSVQDIDPDLLIENLIDSVGYIQLETTPESMFADVRGLEILNDKFYILDFRGTSILSFDKTGKFLKKVAAQGKGPNEYIVLDWMYSDPYTHKILAVDGFSNKIFIYDENLALEKMVHTDFRPRFIISFRDKELLQYNSVNKEQEQSDLLKNFDLHTIDTDGKVTEGHIANRTPGRNGIGSHATSSHPDGSISFLPVLGDTVYNISVDGTIKPVYVLETDGKHIKGLSEKQRNDIELDPDPNQTTYASWEEKGYILPFEIFDNGTPISITFNLDKSLRYLYSPQTGKSYLYDPMKIQGDNALKFMTQKAMVQQGRWFYQPYNAITMQNLTEYYKFSGKYLDMINEMEPDANPVIIYYKFKPF